MPIYSTGKDMVITAKAIAIVRLENGAGAILVFTYWYCLCVHTINICCRERGDTAYQAPDVGIHDPAVSLPIETN
jgi:hypothetical protein